MLKESKLLNAPAAVPVILSPNFGLDFPVDLELWHRSGSRISFAIGEVCFTQFDAADADALFEIRNHPTVIPFMPGAQAIPRQRHLDWVGSTLLATSKDTPLILLGRAAGRAVGFGILKPTAEAGVLEIGVIVAGEWQRKSLPPQLGGALIAVAAQLFGAHTLVSYVNMQHNHALRLNSGAGLVQAPTSGKPGEHHFRTPVETLRSTPIYRRCTRGLRIAITE
jgi:RimJ/RimL family protein N-acetyltransferase